ncbi:uncharacterized protein LOC111641491 [Centruroides sculpturatus]|uniref:uncharacterized protein LOC111641491 n=1 Tax=Centruroides sculpturatus TaxID=218467 RepID=UPI000C6EAFC7|nr:uncharacterized protein LOC111641491 [Centruroides sculpturatus]
MGCRGVTPCPPDLFRVRYLGSTTLSLSRKQIGIGVLQRPLLELYSAARRRGDDHRKSSTLTLNQRLDISDYGLVVAKNDRDNSTIVIKVITPVSNIALWAAVRFHSKIGKRRSFAASFAPIACSEGIVDPKWYIQLGNKQRFLVSLTHPSLFTCLLRRVASPKSFECHAFVCATAEDALTISSLLGNVKDQRNRLGSISPFSDSTYYKNSLLSTELLYTEDDTVTDVTIPHSPLTPSSGFDYRKSDVLDDNNQLASSFSDSTCVFSDGRQSNAFISDKSYTASPVEMVTLNVQNTQKRFHTRGGDTMTISKTMDFGSESEAGWSSKWEPAVPPRRNRKSKSHRSEPLLQIEEEHRAEYANSTAKNWEKEELSETLDFSSESDLSSGSDSRFLTIHSPHSVTTDSDIDYRIKTQDTLRRSFHSERKRLNNGFGNGHREIECKNWSSDSPTQFIPSSRSATIPRTKTKPKGIRWCSDEPRPQRPNFLVAIKKFSMRSFNRAKFRTDKLINSFRSKITKMKSKDAVSSTDSAYETPEVCLRPDGNTSRQKVWRFSNTEPVNSRNSKSLRYPSALDQAESSSGSQLGNSLMRQTPHRKKRRRRRRWQPGPKSSSDSGVEEYHSDYSDTLNGMQKSESELEHFASKVSLVNVEHGMSPSEFRKWSKTNIHEELGYIP